jgi:tripartite-type tricarboxylate transporter receptor subunit TctC
MLMMSMLDSPMTPVSYKGVGPAMIDLLGGQIDLMCDQATNTISHIRSGKIKAYAVTTRSRIPELPDLPTLDEAGLKGFETTVWHGLYAPAGVSKEVVDKIVGALQAAVQDPHAQKRLADLATVAVAPERATPDALQTTYRAEIAKWEPLVKAAGVYAD